MKITFICGSLAPGKDGVGDYTRRLAEELQAHGHQCQLISINDSETTHDTSTSGVEVERFRDGLEPDNSKEINRLVDLWKPDWISLQFVCFAFHPKGFIHELTPLIKDLRQGRKLEIMFHELWVGEQPSLPFKHKIMGRIQEWQILRAMKIWQPDSLHTSNRLYQHVLKRHGWDSERLPIFGNITIAEPNTPENLQVKEGERVILFPFSQRHDWNLRETLDRLLELSKAADVSLKLVQIGGLRSGLQHWDHIESFVSEHNWSYLRLGPQSEETISQWMLAADIGISSAHIHLADKSGAAIAMHEHGLPVICTITEPVSKRFRDPPNPDDGLYSLFDEQGTLVELFRNPPKRLPQSRLPKTALNWVESMEESPSNG